MDIFLNLFYSISNIHFLSTDDTIKKNLPIWILVPEVRLLSLVSSPFTKIPFVDENSNIKSALKIFNKKNLGVLIAKNKRGITTGIISDGDFKRINYKSEKINDIIIKKVMKKKPIMVNENTLAVEALSIMNSKKITALCVYKKNRKKTTGLIHMHSILNANIA